MTPSLLFVGLGNPGSAYAKARHNAGFWAVEALHKELGEGEWKDAPKFTSRVCEARLVTAPVLLVEPQTFMNRSGEAVVKLTSFYKLQPTQAVIFCDDVDLPLGTVRIRTSGSAGTHNGLKSVIEHCGEKFPRVRIGIGPKDPQQDLGNWVLSTMPKGERAILEKVFEKLPGMLREFVLGDGKETTMTVDPLL